MIAFLDELMVKLFGVRQELPIPVRVEDEQSRDKQLKGRK